MQNSSTSQSQHSSDAGAFGQLATLLPVVDLTDLIARQRPHDRPVRTSETDSLIHAAARQMFGSVAPHLLITGRQGVGRSTLVEALARQAAEGE